MNTSKHKAKVLKVLFYACIISLSLGQYSLLLNVAGTKIYLFDIFVFLFALIGIFYFIVIKKSFLIPSYFKYFTAFMLIGFFALINTSALLSIPQFLVSLSYLIRFFMYFMTGIVIYNMLSVDLISKDQIFNTLYKSALFIALLGFIQLIYLPDFTVLNPILGWDPHKNRLASTFFDPNFTGGYLALVLSLFIGELISRKKYSKSYYIFYFLIPLIALVLTFSRSAWLMFAVILFVYGVYKTRLMLFIAVLLAFTAYFTVPRIQTRFTGLTDPADSAAFRLISWSNTLDIAKDNLLIGTGFNNFKFMQLDYGYIEKSSINSNSASGSDSSFLLVLATTGVFGLLFFSIGYLVPIFSSVVVTASLFGLLAQTQFINAFFYPQILFLWGVIIASYQRRI